MTVAVGEASRLRHDIAVHCRGVTKTYGTGDARGMALRGIDLDVRQGELLMLAGPSGCGKTTLISVIAAILDQDSGKCEVLGRDLQQMGQRERARFRGVSIGFVSAISARFTTSADTMWLSAMLPTRDLAKIEGIIAATPMTGQPSAWCVCAIIPQ
ncbi:MAG: ATP-binding cassette domain-containing protein [Methylocella sp.]|nr:MAG: hypothetical protein DLM68_10125 [Hyphomicrobiales bacterium]